MTALPAPAGPRIPAQVIDLGRVPYEDAWRLQLELVGARQRDEIPDTLLLVEHPDVLTLGRSAKRGNLLGAAAALPTFEVERGGDVTYHGPGQLVGYPLFALRDRERDLHLYLRRLEQMLIETCADVGVATGRVGGATGVWTRTEPPRKLASIGIAVRRWVTLHGFALNVSTDLRKFAAINPCGFEAAVMTSLSACLGQTVELAEVHRHLIARAADVFGRDFAAGSLSPRETENRAAP